MIPGKNIISRKENVRRVYEAAGSGGREGGALKLSAGILGRWSPPRKLLGSKEHLDWLKIHLNVVRITTVQDYRHLKE